MMHGQRAPAEFDDAVELFARKSGRHGRVEFNALMGCWVVHFTRRSDDPVLAAYQAGVLEEEPTESVPLLMNDPKTGRYLYVGLDELGVSGLIELLEKGDTWSGRGTYRSPEDAIKTTRESNEKNREEWTERAGDIGRDIADLSRRETFSLPLVSVPTSLTTPTGD